MLHSFTPICELKTCRHGRLIYLRNDVYIGRSLHEYGEYSEGEVDLFDRFVRPGNVVVEVGANIGAHTLFLARKTGPTGRVLAFEPQRVVFQILCGNIALNGATNTHCWKMALGASAGEITAPECDWTSAGEITAPECDWTSAGNFGGLELTSAGGGEHVPLARLDDFSLPRCDFLKIDVEGMEEDVLRGGAETIARCRPVLYFECDRQEKAASLIACAGELGYRLYWHTPRLFSPQNYLGNNENVFGTIVSQNVLGVPTGSDWSISGLDPVDLPPAARPDIAPGMLLG